MNMEDIGLVLKVSKFTSERDYIQIPDRPTGRIFRGGFMTAAILNETDNQKINYITSLGEIVYAESPKDVKTYVV